MLCIDSSIGRRYVFLLSSLFPVDMHKAHTHMHVHIHTHAHLKFMSLRSFNGLSLFRVSLVFTKLNQCHLLCSLITLLSFPNLSLSASEIVACMSVCVFLYACLCLCECVCVCMCVHLCMSRGQWEWWVCKRVTSSGLYIAPPSSPRLSLGAVLKFQPNSSGQISTRSRLYLTATDN